MALANAWTQGGTGDVTLVQEQILAFKDSSSAASYLPTETSYLSNAVGAQAVSGLPAGAVGYQRASAAGTAPAQTIFDYAVVVDRVLVELTVEMPSQSADLSALPVALLQAAMQRAQAAGA